MLEAYFDDSGRGNGPVFVLGGFLSTTERRAEFTEDWQAALDRDPPLRRFKMQHAMTGSDVWRQWHENTRSEKLDLFHSAVSKHVLLGFACVIHQNAFTQIIQSGVGFTNTIYHLAFTGVIAATMRYHCETCATEKIDFVFDDQRHEFPGALRSFRSSWENDTYLQRYLSGTPRSAIDDEVLPLQAADYLVWQLRRQIAQNEGEGSRIKGLAIVQPRSKEECASGDIPIMVDVWDEARLKELRFDILQTRLADLQTTDLSPELRAFVREHLNSKLAEK